MGRSPKNALSRPLRSGPREGHSGGPRPARPPRRHPPALLGFTNTEVGDGVGWRQRRQAQGDAVEVLQVGKALRVGHGVRAPLLGHLPSTGRAIPLDPEPGPRAGETAGGPEGRLVIDLHHAIHEVNVGWQGLGVTRKHGEVRQHGVVQDVHDRARRQDRAPGQLMVGTTRGGRTQGCSEDGPNAHGRHPSPAWPPPAPPGPRSLLGLSAMRRIRLCRLCRKCVPWRRHRLASNGREGRSPGDGMRYSPACRPTGATISKAKRGRRGRWSRAAPCIHHSSHRPRSGKAGGSFRLASIAAGGNRGGAIPAASSVSRTLQGGHLVRVLRGQVGLLMRVLGEVEQLRGRRAGPRARRASSRPGGSRRRRARCCRRPPVRGDGLPSADRGPDVHAVERLALVQPPAGQASRTSGTGRRRGSARPPWRRPRCGPASWPAPPPGCRPRRASPCRRAYGPLSATGSAGTSPAILGSRSPPLSLWKTISVRSRIFASSSAATTRPIWSSMAVTIAA